MSLRKPPLVPPTLDYLSKLKDDGDPPVDIRIGGINVGLCSAKVTLRSGEEREFHIQADDDAINAHIRAAVEMTGFGPWGLMQYIHLEVSTCAKEAGRRMCDFQVILSSKRALSLPDYVISELSNYEFEVKVAEIGELYRILPKSA